MKLSEKQLLAIVELTKLGHRSYTDVEIKVGISVRTLYNLRLEPVFQQALTQAQTELKERI